MSFDAVYPRYLAIEGTYSNNPADSGGETMWGITAFVARANGYHGPMQQLPHSTALAIYRKRYWDAIRADDIERIAGPEVVAQMFEIGVNCGTGVAGKLLQRFLNVNNLGGTLWPDLVADGAIGNLTIEALARFVAKRGEEGKHACAYTLNALQGAYYVKLAERREKDEAFLWGWLRQRVVDDVG